MSWGPLSTIRTAGISGSRNQIAATFPSYRRTQGISDLRWTAAGRWQLEPMVRCASFLRFGVGQFAGYLASYQPLS